MVDEIVPILENSYGCPSCNGKWRVLTIGEAKYSFLACCPYCGFTVEEMKQYKLRKQVLELNNIEDTP